MSLLPRMKWEERDLTIESLEINSNNSIGKGHRNIKKRGGKKKKEEREGKKGARERAREKKKGTQSWPLSITVGAKKKFCGMYRNKCVINKKY